LVLLLYFVFFLDIILLPLLLDEVGGVEDLFMLLFYIDVFFIWIIFCFRNNFTFCSVDM